MQYASVACVSRQFKQVAWMTPASFKAHSKRVRVNLEDL